MIVDALTTDVLGANNAQVHAEAYAAAQGAVVPTDSGKGVTS